MSTVKLCYNDPWLLCYLTLNSQNPFVTSLTTTLFSVLKFISSYVFLIKPNLICCQSLLQCQYLTEQMMMMHLEVLHIVLYCFPLVYHFSNWLYYFIYILLIMVIMINVVIFYGHSDFLFHPRIDGIDISKIILTMSIKTIPLLLHLRSI